MNTTIQNYTRDSERLFWSWLNSTQALPVNLSFWSPVVYTSQDLTYSFHGHNSKWATLWPTTSNLVEISIPPHPSTPQCHSALIFIYQHRSVFVIISIQTNPNGQQVNRSIVNSLHSLPHSPGRAVLSCSQILRFPTTALPFLSSPHNLPMPQPLVAEPVTISIPHFFPFPLD